MKPWIRVVATLHVLALAIWLGTLIMTGVAAAVVFPEMRVLEPTLGAYPSYTGEHWMLAAGWIASKIFSISDAIQVACGAVAGLTLIAALLARRMVRPSVTGIFRLVGMLIAFGALAYQAGSLGPEMRRHLQEYWMAAQDGRNEDAAFHQSLFQEQHPKASATMATTTGGVLIALVAGAWALSSPRKLVPMPTIQPEYGDE